MARKHNTTTQATCRHLKPTKPNQQDSPLVLFDKYLVDTTIVDSVEAQLKKMYPYLLPVNDYSWHELLGIDFWADKPHLPIQLAAVCLQYLAEKPDSLLKVLPGSGHEATRFRFD